jgi:hypothetical protein
MNIVVTCTCGKPLSAQPHLAGKRVRCPACGQPISIPTPSPTATSAPPANDALWDDLLHEAPVAHAALPPDDNVLAKTNASIAGKMMAEANEKVEEQEKEFSAFVMGEIFGGIALILGGGLWLVVGFLLGGIAIGGVVMFVLGVLSLVVGIGTLLKR